MTRKLKNWLKTYLQFTKFSEAPEIFHFWTAVSTLAGALQRRVWIDQRYFQWTPNKYIILVAPPGIATKSTSMGIGLSLLEQVPGINFGPSSMSWQSLTKAFTEVQVDFPINGETEPSKAIYATQSAITCSVSELGTFLNPRDQDLVDFLTDMWEGKKRVWVRETFAHGRQEIVNPWLNLIGGTTPAWLKASVPEAMIGGGLASRIVFVYGDRKRHFNAYPGLSSPTEEYNRTEEALVHDLCLISEMVGEMFLTEEAILWGQTWYQEHWTSRPIHMASDRFEGYISRKQTHVHKLAMIIQAAKGPSLLVEKDSLIAANKIITATEYDMLQVFESIGVAPTARSLHEIVSFLQTHEEQNIPVSEQMLLRHCLHTQDARSYEEAMTTGIKAGYFKIISGSPNTFKLTADPREIRKQLTRTEDSPSNDL